MNNTFKKRADGRPSFSSKTLSSVFFLSGVAGLGYQVVWGRWLHAVFGASAWAHAAILSAFMAGLALGSYAAGRYCEGIRGSRPKTDPIKVYGVIELLIGAWALSFPWLLDVAVFLQGKFFFHLVEETTVYGLIRFAFCFTILLVPTALMGATFPLLSDYVSRRSDAPARWAGLLYSLNTAGAVAGALLGGFYLVAHFGLTASNNFLVLINFGVAAIAILVARHNRMPAEMTTDRNTKAATGEDPTAGHGHRARLYGLVLGLFLVNGFFNLSYEVLWARALALIIGTTTYAFSVMLAVFLAGIAAGSWWMTRRYPTLKNPLRLLLAIQAAMAIWVLASPLLVNALPYIFLQGLWAFGITWTTSVVLKCVLCVLLLFPLTFAMGAVFPLGINLAFTRPERLAREVGDLYSINTAGGILGAFIAGFAVIPFLGVERGIALTALLHLITVAILLLNSKDAREVLRPQARIWAAVAGLALVLPLMAQWNPLILASGVYFQPRTFYDTAGNLRLKEMMSQVTLRYHAEGASATVDVLENPTGFRALAINGKSVATSNYYDYRVQRLLGILPLLLHPEPKRILVIGLGTGMTSGTSSIDPATESLKIIEINREVIGATEHFLEWNLGVVNKSGTRIVVEDATHYLRFTPERFDVITSDPIHPFVAGAGNLYSIDSYQEALAKLNPGGVFCQWVPLYQLDDPDINSILRTFDEVWDNATVWVTGKDFVLCGARDSYMSDFETFRAKASSEPYAEILQLLGFWTPEEVLSAYVGRLSSLRTEFGEAVVNTVERPYLEFSAPRSIFLNTDFNNLERILKKTALEPPAFLSENPPELFNTLQAERFCRELIWKGFVADRRGDLATATQLARRAYDRCPQQGYVRHFAAHTITAFASNLRHDDPAQALKLLRTAQELDPHTPEIRKAIAELEEGP